MLQRRRLINERVCKVTGRELMSGSKGSLESEDDETVPHPAIRSFRSVFRNARSLTYRLLEGADHELSDQSARSRFRDELTRWMNEVAGRPAAAENGEAHDAA